MSATVKLSSRLPGEREINGVDAIAADLIDTPDTIRCALVWFDVQKVTVDTDTDDHVPTIRVRRFEPLGLLEDVPAAVRDTVAAAYEKRTGQKPVPFEIATAEQIPASADPYGDELPTE